ncbi:translation initiation factor IF-3 [Candidatus Uhrbacteria bacterium]|nr:translation initiation factor IF-3 [Candidatus Uhrbacteria bacterium]
MRIHRHRQRKSSLNIQKYKANDRIRSEEVRVIDENGQALGVMPTAKAIALAQEKELDLVEVSPLAIPPVCKILDNGQFKYQKEKEAKKQKAQSKEVEMKVIRLSVRIGDHDFEVRLKQAGKFLDRGDKVKIELPMRGREKAHRDVAEEVMKRFESGLRVNYKLRVDEELKYLGGRFTIIVAKS